MERKLIVAPIVLILSVAALIFFSLVLFSYHPDDIDWVDTGYRSSDQVFNVLGLPGVYTADWLYTVFGWCALVLIPLPLRLIVPILMLYFRRRLVIEPNMLKRFTQSIVAVLKGGLGIMLLMVFGPSYLVSQASVDGDDVVSAAEATFEDTTNLFSFELPEGIGGVVGQYGADMLGNMINEESWQASLDSVIAGVLFMLGLVILAPVVLWPVARLFQFLFGANVAVMSKQAIRDFQHSIAVAAHLVPADKAVGHETAKTFKAANRQSEVSAKPVSSGKTAVVGSTSAATEAKKAPEDSLKKPAPQPVAAKPPQPPPKPPVAPPVVKPDAKSAQSTAASADSPSASGRANGKNGKKGGKAGQGSGATPPPAPAVQSGAGTSATATKTERAVPGKIKALTPVDEAAYDKLPASDLLAKGTGFKKETMSDEERVSNSERIEAALADYGFKAEVMDIKAGPVVTRYELKPQRGLRVSRIVSHTTDISRTLSVVNLRIVEIVEGTPYFGIEIPNKKRQMVSLSQPVDSKAYVDFDKPLPVALGVGITGEPAITDIAGMPHMLVAGTTGSGKSVCIHGMLVSLLLKKNPKQVRLVLIDPKHTEFAIYEKLPHMMGPVVSHAGEALDAITWCVNEMERRYNLFKKARTNNIAGFNSNLPEDEKELPYILVVIDELADLLMVSGKEIEKQIIRVAQKARASGIHLMLATQRPSADVLTGQIRSNVPARVGLKVGKRADSQIVIDEPGAELLLGHGDMLFVPPGPTKRIHGAFVSPKEINVIVEWCQNNVAAPDWLPTLNEYPKHDEAEPEAPKRDLLFEAARKFVTKQGDSSLEPLQKHLKVGYSRAHKIRAELKLAGVVE